VNLRELVEYDLYETLESGDDWGLPVSLLSPDGEFQDKTVVCSAIDIFFSAVDNSVNSTGTDFREKNIKKEDVVRFLGSENNTSDYTVGSVSERKIFLEESIFDEPSGEIIKILNISMPLNGQVLYDTLEQNPDTGADMIMHKPVVTLRRSSLVRIPEQTERNTWLVSIPKAPSTNAEMQPYIMGYPSEGGNSLGFIRLYLTKPLQSTP